jgi:hypothetical protein
MRSFFNGLLGHKGGQRLRRRFKPRRKLRTTKADCKEVGNRWTPLGQEILRRHSELIALVERLKEQQK